jgi:queuine/archaeosine tRNA-ribosyltransferase
MPKRLTIQLMHQLAESHGGRCLSDVYINAHSKLVWQCAKGHEWMAIQNNVQRGAWCPTCGGNARPTIQQIHALAESRGGKCLSDIYVSMRSKLMWQCARDHKWEATPSRIKRGHWCPKCHGNLRLTLEEMKEVAASRGGLCLSEQYVNSSTHLLWQCREGHQWKAVPNSVKRGSWCPVCSHERRGRRRHEAP